MSWHDYIRRYNHIDQASMFSNNMNQDSKLNMITKAKNALYGITRKDATLNNVEEIYGMLVEDTINKKKEIKKEIEPQEEVKSNTKEPGGVNNDIQIVEAVKIKINSAFTDLKQMTSGYLSNENFVFEQADAFTFCNPLAEDPAKGILKITKKELYQLNEAGVRDILNKFYQDVIQKYEKKDCVGCVNAEHYPNHIECVECSRNDQSASIQKVDKYVKRSS
jgi:hypothetical protein